jgi:large subunit ribosomal protein L31
MKPDIHPEMKATKFVCACGNAFSALSTIGGERHVEICHMCHPYFTGKEKLMDTAGRIEKFNRRYKRGDHAPGAVAAGAQSSAKS